MDSFAPGPALDTSLTQFVDCVPNGVVAIDSAGRILLVNTELEKLFGYERSELLGAPIELLLPERYRAGHVKMRTQYCRHPMPRAIGAGRDLFGLRKDGTEIQIEIGLSPLRRPEGLVIVASIIDITERRRLERNFERIVEAAPCGMLMCNRSGTIVMVNAQLCGMFGYHRAELVGNPMDMLIPDRHRERHDGHRTHFFAHAAPRAMGDGRDLSGLHKNGTEFSVEIGLNPIESEAGLMVLAAVTDISARKKLERDLRQANADLEEFLFVVSHDLKSPLQGISDLLEWIVADLEGGASPEVSGNLRRIDARVRRMQRLVDDLLAYARATDMNASAAQVNIAELVQAVVEFLPRPPGFEIVAACNVSPMKVARTPLETVLRNIVGNAIKHHDRPSGLIEIRADESGSFCRFTVSDDGPGLSDNAHVRLAKLFETFNPPQYLGSGIGLAMTKRLLDKHGGRLVLEPNSKGRGTTVRFWWPRSVTSAASHPRDALALAEPQTPSGCEP